MGVVLIVRLITSMCKSGTYSASLAIFSHMVALFLSSATFNSWIWIEFLEKYRGEVHSGSAPDLVCIFSIYNHRSRFNTVDSQILSLSS